MNKVTQLQQVSPCMLDDLKTRPLPQVRGFFLTPIFIISVIMNFHSAKAQSITKNWDRSYIQNSIYIHTNKAAVRNPDGTYLLAGHYEPGNIIGLIPSDNNAYWVVKISSTGTQLWAKSFGGSGQEELTSIVRSSDGGYLLCGSSQSGISGDKTQGNRGSFDFWVVKINSLGTKQWDRRYGGNLWDKLTAAIATPDGGYLLAGYSISNISGEKTQAGEGSYDYWVVKINSTGAKQWDRRFGGNGWDELTSIAQASDGGFLLGGLSTSGISDQRTQASRGSFDYWIVKINSLGTKQWDRRFGGSASDRLNSLVSVSDGGFLLAGWSLSGLTGDKSQAGRGSYDYWVVRINSAGGKIWDRRFGGSNSDILYSAISVSGGFMLAGSSLSGLTGDKTQSSRGGNDYWIVRINSTGGKLWDRRYGGTGNDVLGAILAEPSTLTTTSTFLLSGSSNSGITGDRSRALRSAVDFWALKITQQPVIIGSTIPNNNIEEETTTTTTLKASPNPFSNRVQLSFTNRNSDQVNLQVYDTKGSSVANLYKGKVNAGETYRFEMAANSLPSGIYFAQLWTPTEVKQVKLLLVRK